MSEPLHLTPILTAERENVPPQLFPNTSHVPARSRLSYDHDIVPIPLLGCLLLLRCVGVRVVVDIEQLEDNVIG